jgi:hypothetical protein
MGKYWKFLVFMSMLMKKEGRNTHFSPFLKMLRLLEPSSLVLVTGILFFVNVDILAYANLRSTRVCNRFKYENNSISMLFFRKILLWPTCGGWMNDGMAWMAGMHAWMGRWWVGGGSFRMIRIV